MITFGTGTATIVDDSNATKPHTYTVVGGDDCVLLIAVASERGGGVSSVTVDGNAATEVVTSTVGDEGMASLWAYNDPPTGSVSIVVTPGDIDEPIFIGADTAYGVNIGTITDNTATNSGDSNAPSVSVPSATGTVVVGVFGMTNGSTITATTGTLLCSDHGAGPADVSGGMSWAPGGAGASLAWSIGASDNWNAVGAVLTETAGATVADVPVASLDATAFAPTVTTGAHVNVPSLAATATAFAPTVTISTGTTVTLPAAAATSASHMPTLTTGAHVVLESAVATSASHEPTVATTGNDVVVNLTTATAMASGYAITVATGASVAFPTATATAGAYALFDPIPDPVRPRRVSWVVRIAGIVTPVRSIHTEHDVDKPVAVGRITLRAPIPPYAVIGAEVTIHAGYDGASLPLFRGRIPQHASAFSERGGEVTISLEGKGADLMYRHDIALGVQGPISFYSWWRSLCAYVGVDAYLADSVEDVDGVELTLGDNEFVNDGIVIVDARDAPGHDMARRAELVGYRHFETPTHVRLQRISGLPTEDVEDLVTFEEGVNCRSVQRVASQEPMANYWDVWGAKYVDGDGADVQIHSFPAVITRDYVHFGKTGVKREEIRDQALDTVALADAARTSHETDYSEESATWRWTTRGDPVRMPGQQVALSSPKVGEQVQVGDTVVSFPVGLWLTRVVQDLSERGWETTMEGWQGAGTALPAGDDCATVSILNSTGVHVGDETLSYYRTAAPNGNTDSGAEHRITFSVPNTYTTLTLTGYVHGCNSEVADDETDVSRIEVWQGGERQGTGDLPFLPENSGNDYDSDSGWSPVTVPLPGTLAAGSAELRIISGSDGDEGRDDFEARSLVLRLCGVGSPAVVDEGGD